MKEKGIPKTIGRGSASIKEKEDNAVPEAVGSWKGSMNTTLLGMGMTSSAKIAIIEGQEYGCDQKTNHADTITLPKQKRHKSESDSQNFERRLQLWKIEHSLK